MQEVYLRLGRPVPIRLYLPVFAVAAATRPALPSGVITPVVDGRLTDDDGWDRAGVLPPESASTMQRTEGTRIVEARFGWGPEQLFLLLIPRDRADLEGIEIDLELTGATPEDAAVCHFVAGEGGRLEVTCTAAGRLTGGATGAWNDVVELALPIAPAAAGEQLGLTLRVGRGGLTDHVFSSAGLAPVPEA